jgi:NADH dehydrogenase FAD-containing subunit
MSTSTRIAVLGGGFAGLEAAFLLRSKLGDRAEITLVSDRGQFLFKPNTIYIPFGGQKESLLIPLTKAAGKRSIRFLQGRFESLDKDARVLRSGGEVVPYDYLVLATGAGMRPEDVPGLAEHAETIWTPEEMSALGEKLSALVAENGREGTRTILFLVPPNNKCAGPLYEIVLMVETWLRRREVRDRFELVWTTYEPSYIAAFGPKLHAIVSEEFAERGVEGHTGWRVETVDAETVRYENGEQRRYDLLVSFPPYVAAVDYGPFGLPVDDRGFLACEPQSRRVVGEDRIYAPGDGGDFPVKQAFLAFLQADAVAEDIAARLEGRRPDFGFDPVSMCVMEEFDKATFAQVPLQVTGDPARPVEVRPDANGDYRVGVSPLWRIGKKMLGLYLPLRFANGRPFHAGAPWAAMNLGLKGMSAVLARK